MIDARAPDCDADVRRLSELGRSLAQGDNVHRARPRWRGRSEGRDPQHAIGLPRRDESLSVETPRVMDRAAGAKSGPHRKAGCPPASRQNPYAIVRRGQRQCREARGVVQVAHKSMQHLDFERAETCRSPNGDAEASALQGDGDRVEIGQRQPGTGVRRFSMRRFLTRARSAARLTASVPPRPAAQISISPSNPAILAPMAGASHTMRRLTSAPSGLAGQRQQPLVEVGPGFRQAVAHEQHEVSAHAGFAGRREHDSGFAHCSRDPATTPPNAYAR